jgi:hypothetical protein
LTINERRTCIESDEADNRAFGVNGTDKRIDQIGFLAELIEDTCQQLDFV